MYELFGYIILRNILFNSGKSNANSIEWEEMETGFELDYSKKKLYKTIESVNDAVDQLKKHFPKDKFEIHPVYWKGRNVINP